MMTSQRIIQLFHFHIVHTVQQPAAKRVKASFYGDHVFVITDSQ